MCFQVALLRLRGLECVDIDCHVGPGVGLSVRDLTLRSTYKLTAAEVEKAPARAYSLSQ